MHTCCHCLCTAVPHRRLPSCECLFWRPSLWPKWDHWLRRSRQHSRHTGCGPVHHGWRGVPSCGSAALQHRHPAGSSTADPAGLRGATNLLAATKPAQVRSHCRATWWLGRWLPHCSVFRLPAGASCGLGKVANPCLNVWLPFRAAHHPLARLHPAHHRPHPAPHPLVRRHPAHHPPARRHPAHTRPPHRPVLRPPTHPLPARRPLGEALPSVAAVGATPVVGLAASECCLCANARNDHPEM